MSKNARQLVPITPRGTAANGAQVVSETVAGSEHTTILYLNAVTVTMALNATTSAGGGTKIYDFPEGLILPVGGSSNLTVAGTGSKSYLASLGTVAADTSGTLTGTEITFAPQTAATTTSGAGTCKMKSTVLAPVPGTPVDGTATAADMYLNACLNADGTGATILTFTGYITYVWDFLGDN
jgi:hypothetical protein